MSEHMEKVETISAFIVDQIYPHLTKIVSDVIYSNLTSQEIIDASNLLKIKLKNSHDERLEEAIKICHSNNQEVTEKNVRQYFMKLIDKNICSDTAAKAFRRSWDKRIKRAKDVA